MSYPPSAVPPVEGGRKERGAMRESMVMYHSFMDAMESLDAESYKAAMQGIMHYAMDGIMPELDGAAKMAFLFMKPQVDANNRRYENGKRGAEYGKLGGRPKKVTPEELEEKGIKTPKKPQQNPTSTPNVNVNVNDNVNDIKTISTERSAPLPAVISLPLNDGTLYPITQPDIDKWTELYPAVNVISELRKMVGWLDANKDRRKTRKGVLRFVVNWLSGQQDKSPQKGAQMVKMTRFANFTGRDTDIEAETLELSRKVLGI